MQLSYAQCLEDYHLERVFGAQEAGFYIDVGAGHPVADNVSYHFYLKGWHGLVVEPQASLAKLYPRLRPRDHVVDHLVGAEDGEVDFHIVNRLHGFSTIVEENARGAASFGADFQTRRMRIRPLSTLLEERRIRHVDFLKVDVEGAEPAVLDGMDWQNVRPKVLCIEAIAPGSMADTSSTWEPQTRARGYRFAFSDGLNRFYVAEEHAELAARFPTSPTPWESVTHFYELGRADQRADHPDHALAKRLVRGFLATLPERSADEILDLLRRSAGANGLEQGEALDALINGLADVPGVERRALLNVKGATTFSDRAWSALGRIAAQYDGGMVQEEEG
jgi:FkbM family methyltransferase